MNIEKNEDLVVDEDLLYEMVANESARGIMNASLKHKTPVINAILTCENEEQVKERINTNTTISGLNLLSEVLKHNL